MLKAAAHLHSNFSYDGKLTLPELRVLLQKYGIQCALMTEHTDNFTSAKAAEFFAACREASTPDFLFIPGFEVAHGDAHLLMLGTGAYVEGTDLAAWRQASGYCALAHPHRNHYTLDVSMRQVINAIEVWNSQYDGKHSPRLKAEKLLIKENESKPMRAWAGWDLHRTEHAGGPMLIINAHELSTAAVMQALQSGEFSIATPPGSPLRGAYDRATITVGRTVNAVLASLGLKLPKSITSSVRKSI